MQQASIRQEDKVEHEYDESLALTFRNILAILTGENAMTQRDRLDAIQVEIFAWVVESSKDSDSNALSG